MGCPGSDDDCLRYLKPIFDYKPEGRFYAYNLRNRRGAKLFCQDPEIRLYPYGNQRYRSDDPNEILDALQWCRDQLVPQTDTQKLVAKWMSPTLPKAIDYLENILEEFSKK